MKIENLEKRAEEAVLKFLEGVPFASAELISGESTADGKRPNLFLKICLPDKEQLLVVEIKRSGQPKPAREGVNQILRYKELYPDAYGVLIAPYISSKAASICSQAGVGYLDLAGNCSIAFGQVYIRVDGRPNPFSRDRSLRSLYAPKASRLLRVLLANPIDKVWKVEELSKEADISIGHVSNVKNLLDEREWIEDYEVGFSLSDPNELLREWSKNYSYRKNQFRDFYSLSSVSEIEVEVAESCREFSIEYALTGFSGAARMAPAVRYQRAMAYILGDMDKLAQQIGLKEVKSGANVTLLEPYDKGVFYGSREYDGIPVTSPIQLYLDLKSFRGRGEEAAEALLEQVIKPKW